MRITYTPVNLGDPEETDVAGQHFVDGQTVELDDNDPKAAALGRLQGNPSFHIEGDNSGSLEPSKRSAAMQEEIDQNKAELDHALEQRRAGSASAQDWALVNDWLGWVRERNERLGHQQRTALAAVTTNELVAQVNGAENVAALDKWQEDRQALVDRLPAHFQSDIKRAVDKKRAELLPPQMVDREKKRVATESEPKPQPVVSSKESEDREGEIMRRTDRYERNREIADSRVAEQERQRDVEASKPPVPRNRRSDVSADEGVA